MEDVPREHTQSSRWGARSGDSWASAFFGGQSEVCKEKAGGGSMVHVSVTRSQLGQEGNLWLGPPLPHGYTWLPGGSILSLFEGGC